MSPPENALQVQAVVAYEQPVSRSRRIGSAPAVAVALLVHGKYHDRLDLLRPDVADAVRTYLATRESIAPDELGEALIVANGKPVAIG